jgi:branched-chain amino acid transport system permease protein
LNLLTFSFDVVSYTAIFVLIATGLILTVQLMGLYNFAHGEFVLVGGMSVYSAQALSLGVWTSFLLAPVAGFALGWAADRALLRRIYQKPQLSILATFALGLAIREVARLQLGGQYVSVEAPIGGTLSVAGAIFPVWRSVVLGVCIVVGVALWALIRFSAFGLHLRGVLDNTSLARASGISAKRINTTAFASAAAITALAGALIAPVFSVHADMGVPFLIKAFLAAALGSDAGVAGGLAAAVLIGLCSSVLPLVLDPVVTDAVLLLLAVLALRFVGSR